MDFKVVTFTEVSRETWDSWVAAIGQTSYFHSWNWIDYCSKFPDIQENLSFACLQDTSTPLAVCPLGLTRSGSKNEMSFSGTPSGFPALADLKPSLRRKMLDAVFDIIYSHARRNSVETIKMILHPLSAACCTGVQPPLLYGFEPLRYNMLYHVNNTLIIDLRLPEHTLLDNVSKYQRRHIKKAKASGLTVSVFNSRRNTGQLEEFFSLFQQAHLAAAGRVTRPQETWDSMLARAFQGTASLFVALLEETPVSYLYCGEFSSMAFGWSQANVKEYEKKYSTRHLLEWEAILYYKNAAFAYYEVGERYYGPQLLYIPTDKEISISEFKERYGGFMLPKILWFGYGEQNRMRSDLKTHADAFIEQAKCFSPPLADS